MRTTFIETLLEVAARDERVWLLNGDLGYSVLERFAERFPGRYLNAGVAEQNMTGIAAGLAMSGKVVFTYSIANFPVFRCLEQIRNDVCGHRLNVKITAVGGGLAYGSAGYSHHGVEDLAVMSALPGMTVVAPGDPAETRQAVRALVEQPGPAYLRLGKAGEPRVHAVDPPLRLGKMLEVRPGNHVTLVSIGGMLHSAVQAADLAGRQGLSVQVLSCPTLVPLDEETLLAAARRTGHVVTVEEHGPGGLGTRVGEALAQASQGVRFVPLRLKAEPIFHAGSQDYLKKAHGLSPEGIAQALLSLR
jgi:transketolase